MKHFVMSVRDRAADTFGRPFFVAKIGQATRTFSDEVNRPGQDNPLFNHPEDFDLYEVGTFDDDNGELEPCVPRMVAVGKDMKAPKEV